MSPQTKNDQEGAIQIGYASGYTKASLQVIFWKVRCYIWMFYHIF